jgi:hypothetical protein
VDYSAELFPSGTFKELRIRFTGVTTISSSHEGQ